MIFAVNKPQGLTSHDVVASIRRWTGVKRVGHGGTLDPLAGGVLVIGVGAEGTRALGDYQRGQDKVYAATIRLGATSATDDGEGPLTPTPGVVPSMEDGVRRALESFVGEREQLPPQFSAVKIGGVPAYRRMRRGEVVVIPPRQVKISAIQLLEYGWPDVRIRLTCGSGVYVRSVARDLGEMLETGGYLLWLCREQVGSLTLQQALPYQEEAIIKYVNDSRALSRSLGRIRR